MSIEAWQGALSPWGLVIVIIIVIVARRRTLGIYLRFG